MIRLSPSLGHEIRVGHDEGDNLILRKHPKPEVKDNPKEWLELGEDPEDVSDYRRSPPRRLVRRESQKLRTSWLERERWKKVVEWHGNLPLI